MKELTEGDPAPDFTLPRSGGGSVSLHDLKEQDVVLYFYPKDDTPGCTKEACSFRDHYDALSAADAIVLGISPDSIASHERFADKYNLPFVLLSDPDHSVAEVYGVWKEKSMYGKRYMGVERTTFLIDGQGTIRTIWRKVKPEAHAPEVLATVGAVR